MDERREREADGAARGPDLESAAGYVLLGGLLLSLTFLVAGLVGHWAAGTAVARSISPRSVFALLAGGVQGLLAGPRTPSLLVELGLSLLLLTPYARVLTTLGFFVARRDWKYAAMTAFVAAVLTACLWAG